MTKRDLVQLSQFQVFLNYPFDSEFEPFAHAMHFGVAAANLIPVCARDVSMPDRPRLEMLVDAIGKCQYSVHDLSRCRGEGDQNLARLNMPLEMGMALFHALHTQRQQHRCAFFTTAAHEYQAAASDLAGLDPVPYDGRNERSLVGGLYTWLHDTLGPTLFSRRLPTVEVQTKYEYFKTQLLTIDGSGEDGRPNHDEVQELIFQICTEAGWWIWRGSPLGLLHFPALPLSRSSGLGPTHE